MILPCYRGGSSNSRDNVLNLLFGARKLTITLRPPHSFAPQARPDVDQWKIIAEMRPQFAEAQAPAMFALRALCREIIVICDISEPGGFVLGVFHSVKVSALRLGESIQYSTARIAVCVMLVASRSIVGIFQGGFADEDLCSASPDADGLQYGRGADGCRYVT